MHPNLRAPSNVSRIRICLKQGSTGGLETGRMPTSFVSFGAGVALNKILLNAVLCGQPTGLIFLCGYAIFVLLKHECSTLIKLATRAVFTGLGQV